MNEPREWPNPCKCGETERIILYSMAGDYHVWVECLTCRTRGESAPHPGGAIRNWNAGKFAAGIEA